MKRALFISVFAAILSLGSMPLVAQGVVHGMPAEYERMKEALDYPMAWQSGAYGSFEEWRSAARTKLTELLLRAPEAPASTDFTLLAEERRDGYTAQKIRFEISHGVFVSAYLLIPDGKGRFPALSVLHDHGARFSIGKEKVVRPIAESTQTDAEAEAWTHACYDGVFVGDYFASNGYVVLAVDALYWGERGAGSQGRESSYDGQQALAANMMRLGTTWCGYITWDDVRSVEFLASLPIVDSARIGVVGHSMGGHRAWVAAAMTDRISAAAAVCSMACCKNLASAGNNELKGQSAYSMLIPAASLYFDNPDIASIACPKPMLFINGSRDKIFPDGYVEAFERMHEVWRSQGADDKLTTRIYDSPHYFDRTMQAEVLQFFDKYLR